MNGSNYNVASAIRGPILLIVLGTLIAMDYFGGYAFSRTWPILLIVFGILKLLEKVAGPPANTQPPYAGPQPTVYPPQGDSVI